MRVHLIDKDDTIPTIADLSNNLFQPLFQTHRDYYWFASHQRTDIQGEQAFCPTRLSGTSPAIRRWARPFNDGGFAHARFSDQGRVVFIAPRQDLNDALDLLVAPDDRIEGIGSRGSCQVNAHLVNGRRFRVLGVAFVGGTGLAEDPE